MGGGGGGNELTWIVAWVHKVNTKLGKSDGSTREAKKEEQQSTTNNNHNTLEKKICLPFEEWLRKINAVKTSSVSSLE